MAKKERLKEQRIVKACEQPQAATGGVILFTSEEEDGAVESKNETSEKSMPVSLLFHKKRLSGARHKPIEDQRAKSAYTSTPVGVVAHEQNENPALLGDVQETYFSCSPSRGSKS